VGNRWALLPLVVVAAGCGSKATAPPTTAGTTTQSAPRPIDVERPTWNATVRSPFHVAGTASVFEATLVVELRTAERVLEKRTVTASEGAPGRGTFDATFAAAPGKLVVRVYAPNAANGQPQHEVDVPVTVAP
jgi:hypothetical protein